MMTSNELGQVYDTMLGIPWMMENVKIDLKISRKVVLLLSQLIERGLKERKTDSGDLLAFLIKEVGDELITISNEALDKAALKSLSEKLKGFGKGS